MRATSGKRFHNVLCFRMLVCLHTLLLLGGMFLAAHAGGIVADHRAVQEYSRIPPVWLAKAKALAIHYGHTSHGSQIMSGLGVLQTINATYAIEVRSAWDNPDWPPPVPSTALRIFDGQPEFGEQPADDYVTPELYWASADGLARTRYVAGLGRYNASMWAFCGQMSEYGSAEINTYLQALNTLEGEFPSMRFIYQTGHTDGGSAQWTSNVEQVRQYVREHNKVLFDFADIEMHDPAGVAHPTMTDACEWCEDWCTAHPEDCDFEIDDCAHTHKLQCIQKAKAMWWLAARLAGWPGAGAVAVPAITTLMMQTP